MRQTGVTTMQMQEAPHAAIYVCPSGGFARSYASSLAHHLGRDDIECVGPNFLVSDRMLGCDRMVVIDHTALDELSSVELVMVSRHNDRARERMTAAQS